MGRNRTKWVGVGITAATAVIFGLHPPSAKMAYADGANAAFVILVTTLLRAASLWGFCSVRGMRVWPRTGEWGDVVSGGFFQALSVFGVIGSLVYLPGPVTIILLFTHTIMLLFFLAFKGEVELTPLAVATTLAALFGVSLVVDLWDNLDGVDLRGVALAVLAAFATVTRLYVFGKQVQQKPPPVVGAQVFSGAFVFTLLILIVSFPAPPHSLAGAGWVLACAASLAVGTLGMFYGIAYLGSFQFSLMVKLEPMFTALFSYLILHEVLKVQQYAGMLLVVGSLITFQYYDRLKAGALRDLSAGLRD